MNPIIENIKSHIQDVTTTQPIPFHEFPEKVSSFILSKHGISFSLIADLDTQGIYTVLEIALNLQINNPEISGIVYWSVLPPNTLLSESDFSHKVAIAVLKNASASVEFYVSDLDLTEFKEFSNIKELKVALQGYKTPTFLRTDI